MNLKPFFLLFILLLPLANADLYMPDKTLSSTDYSLSRYASTAGGEYVLAFTPTSYATITATLQGEGAYQPRIKLYDPLKNTFLITVEGVRGKESTLAYTFGDARTAPYYLIVNDHGDGEHYAATMQIMMQDDAGTGQDAPSEFKQGSLLTVGTYDGFLGDNDNKDQYAIALQAGENLTITLTAQDDGSLGITLVDATGFTKIEGRKTLKQGATYTAPYVSLKNQTVYLGISGDVPYMLNLTSNKHQPSVTEAPPAPEPAPVEITTTPEIPEQQPAPAPTIVIPAEPERPLWGLVISILALLLIILGFVFKKKLAGQKRKKNKAIVDDHPKKAS